MQEKRSFGNDFTEKGIGRRTFDTHIDEIARLDSLHGEKVADFVEHGPPRPSFGIAFADAFEENLLDGILEEGVSFCRTSLQILQKYLIAKMFCLFRYIVRIVSRGLRARTRRVTEDVGHVIHDILHKLAGHVEVILRLRGETNDDIRREIDLRQPFADFMDAIQIFRRRIGAPHELQNSV